MAAAARYADYNENKDIYGEYDMEYSMYDSGGQVINDEAAYASSDQVRKEVKNVNCTLTVKDVKSVYNSLYEIVDNLGGYEFNKTETNRDGIVYYNLTLKLPPENLQEFETRLRSIAGDNAVTYYNVSSQDITSAYYDTSARIESMKASLTQYYAMISRANTVTEMLEIRREITILQAEIDSLQGQLNVWNMLVSYATIDMQIQREDDPLAQTRAEQWSFNTPSEILNAMGNGFITTSNIVYRVIVGIFVVLISLLPALILIGIIVLIVIFIRRKIKAKSRAQSDIEPGRGVPGGGFGNSGGGSLSGSGEDYGIGRGVLPGSNIPGGGFGIDSGDSDNNIGNDSVLGGDNYNKDNANHDGDSDNEDNSARDGDNGGGNE